jgi:hypothetical protein
MEHAVGLATGAPVIVQLVSLESKPVRLTVTNVPGIPFCGLKLAEAADWAYAIAGRKRANSRISNGMAYLLAFKPNHSHCGKH